MARAMLLGETILDFIDTLIQFTELEHRSISGIALNQFEWVQFINCVNMNYADCQAVAELDNEKPACGKYKGIYLYWDGTENNSDEFLYNMHEMKERMENTRRRNIRPEEAPDATAPVEMPRGRNRTYAIAGAGWVNDGRLDPRMTGRFVAPEAQEEPRQAAVLAQRVNF